MLLFNAFVGLRPSEIIAVKYSNIDFVTQTLKVEKQLGKDIKDLSKGKDNCSSTKQEIRVKTRYSRRGTHIPDFVFQAILEEKKKYEENRVKYKDKHTNLGYICCDRYGNPRCRNYHYEEFKKLLRDNNLPDIAWRNLRATCAIINMDLGATLKTTSKRLGHAKEIVTADHYVDRKRLAVRKIKKLDEYIESLYEIETANKRIAKIDIDKLLYQ